MKLKLTAVIIVLLTSAVTVNSQSYHLKLKNNTSHLKTPSLSGKSDLPTPWFVLGITAIISPVAVFEDKKVYFGLTKEISLAKVPFGRLAFEYSYIFRKYNSSHLRFSYNYDFILEAGNFIAFTATPGAGYFTDTKNKGWFLQGSAGVLFAWTENIALSPYLRYRHTFISNKAKTDINDISLAVAVIFFF